MHLHLSGTKAFDELVIYENEAGGEKGRNEEENRET
jgi:hypothetical protein